MFGIIIRDLTHLKIMLPIMEELRLKGQKCNLYCYDVHRGEKEYNRARPNIVSQLCGLDPSRIRSFSSDQSLLRAVKKDGVLGLIGVEIGINFLSCLSGFKREGVATFSLGHWVDFFGKSPEAIRGVNKNFYVTKFTMETCHRATKTEYAPKRDFCLGSPLIDCMGSGLNSSGCTIFSPNIRTAHINKIFGSYKEYVQTLENLLRCAPRPVVIKTRKKQFLPDEISSTNKVVTDGKQMYPSVVSNLLYNSFFSVIFFSSGVYEAVLAENTVLNVPFDISVLQPVWGNSAPVKEYFSTDNNSLYNWEGVVESVPVRDVLKNSWKYEAKRIDQSARGEWLDRFVGDIPENSAREIVEEILK